MINTYTIKAYWDKDQDNDGKNDECYFLKGSEITMLDDRSNPVHLVVIGDYIPESKQSIEDTIEKCNESDSLLIISHPAAGKLGSGMGIEKAIEYYSQGKVDALEINTSFPWPFSLYFNGTVKKAAKTYEEKTGKHLALVTNPDAHIPNSYFWTGVTLFKKDYDKYGEKGFPKDDLINYIKECLENNNVSSIELYPHSWESFWWLVKGFI